MEYVLHAGEFSLWLHPELSEDGSLPSDTLYLDIAVKSNGFSGSTSVSIRSSELSKFALDLNSLYHNLSGEAWIEGHSFLSFTGNGRGHIAVRGSLFQGTGIGDEHTLTFQNQIDQTDLKEFCAQLLRDFQP